MAMEKEHGDPQVYVAEDGTSNSDSIIEERRGSNSDAEDMKRMGKEQLFKRNFGFLSIFGFSMILMSTWEAWLGTVAFGLGNGGTAGMIYMYIAVFVLFSLVIVAMAEMASMAPTAGGQYHWVSEFAPRNYQKQLSFFVGWLCVLGWQTGCAIGCFLAAGEIQGLVILNQPDYVPQPYHLSLMAIAMVLFVAIFNTFLAKHLPLVEGLVLFLHLAGFFAIIVPIWVLGPRSPSSEVWTEFDNEGGWSSTGAACLVGLIGPVTSLLGSDAATHMSEELKNASKTLPRAMVATAVFNGALGFVMVITFVYTVGDVESVLSTKTGWPFIQFFYNATGSKAGATAMTSIMVVLATANGMTNMATASRQLFAFARDKGVPFHTWFAHVPQGWDIPLNSIFFTIIFASLLPLINIGSFVAFNQIVSLGLCALLTSYAVSISCVAARRIRGEPLLESRFNLGKLGLPIDIIAVLFVSLATVMSFFPPVVNPAPAQMNWACVVYAGTLIVAGLYYVFRARHHYVGPVEYVRKSV